MKSLTARQLELTSRPTRARVTLIKITTYSDKSAGTVDTSYYFADRPAVFDLDNTGTPQRFLPYLMRIDGSLVQAMDHLPTGDGSDSARGVRLVLANTPYPDVNGAVRLVQQLRTHKLELATVKVAELDLDLASRASDEFDFRAIASSEQIVWLRGEITSVGPVTNAELSIDVVKRSPEIGWTILNDAANNDPKDLGKRKGVIYGAAKRVPCLGVLVGWASTNINPFGALYTGNINITDTSGFPGGNFTLRMAAEEMTVSVVSAGILDIVTRAINGTTATDHLAGTVAIEVLSTATWSIADHALKAIDAVYVESPYNGELTLVESYGYTADLANGEFDMSAANLRTLLNKLEVSARVSAQPAVSHVVTVADIEQHPISASHGALRDHDLSSGATHTVGDADFSVTFYDPGNIVTQDVYVNIGGSTTADVRIFDGSVGLLFTITDDSSGTYAFTTTYTGNTFYIDTTGSGSRDIDEVWRVVTYNAPDPSLSTDTAIAGTEFGFGLRFYADVQGYAAPDGTNYSVGNGVLLEKTADILRHLIAVRCGAGHTAIDATTFSAVATAGNKLACNLADLGDHFDAIAHRLAFESACNLAAEEGASATAWKLLQPLLSGSERYYFSPTGAPTLVQYDWLDIEEEGRTEETIYTRFRALYDRDPSIGTGEDAFRAVLRADKDSNALDPTYLDTSYFTAAEQNFGRKDHPGFAWLAVRDPASAKFALGYYAQEHMRVAATLKVVGAPWWHVYAIELGDLLHVPVPWRSVSVACRVIGFEKSWAEDRITIVCVEVLTS